MKKKIIIFGGGISGLTCAHELIEKGFDVTLIEKDSLLGGMAKSRREFNNIASEHSWRGYAPFYNNTFDIMKRIPLSNSLAGSDETVYNNLSKPITFYITRDDIAEYTYTNSLNFNDKLWIAYYLFKYICSNNRRDEYYKIKLIDILKNKISDDAYKFLIDFMCGPGYGIEKKDASYAHYFKFVSIFLLNQSVYKNEHNYNNVKYYSKANDKWHVMNQPTNEAWFDHWEQFLKGKGIVFLMSSELTKINIVNNKIINCVINNNIILQADEYILCINPFNAEQLFKTSNANNLYNQHYLLNKNTDSRQVAFRFGFNKKINFLLHSAFIFPDSDFNITLYPQDFTWNQDVKLDNNNTIKSLWSGTVLELYRTSTLYNKPGLYLTKDELMNEIIYQVLRSKSFQKIIFDNNNFYLNKSDIFYNEIWYEWNINPINKQLEQSNKKWITNVFNEEFRPSQKIENISNLYIGGAHTKTSISVWSMEGAVESGKIVSNLILNKYNLPKTYLHTHNDPSYLNIFKFIDDILYKLNLPNIIDVILFILFLLLIYYFNF
jgi:hypothetical protein